MYPHTPHLEDQPILACERLSVTYNGSLALDDITFHLHPGELVALVGPNGAGKSTLLKVIAGVLPPTRGKVSVFGSGPRGHVCIAFIPQRSQVEWQFPVNVADVVMMGRSAKLKPFVWPSKRDWERVRAALDTVGMGDLAKRQIGQLSGGQQQRMFIARALAQEAELMLMDEPLTGLDQPSQENLLALLDDLQKQRITVMAATHDLDQAAQHFDRILLLNRSLIAFGDARYVLQPEKLIRAYGRRIRLVETPDGVLALEDSCCDGGEEHEHAA
jgi:manganese/iron transport system ATP-binding protein